MSCISRTKNNLHVPFILLLGSPFLRQWHVIRSVNWTFLTGVTIITGNNDPTPDLIIKICSHFVAILTHPIDETPYSSGGLGR